jgi:3-hydroxybutyryl-CoA dehydrogenase
MAGGHLQERLAIAGAGTIACGLAFTAARHGDVVMWARSRGSADRARASVSKLAEKVGEPETAGRVSVVTDQAALHGETLIVEAVSETLDHKQAVLAQLGAAADRDAILATTTSSLPIAALASASGRPDRFVGLHVFNPVHRMELVELVFGPEVAQEVRERARAFCSALGKTSVEVPDTPGFVVNRLLFPYLFDAVQLMSETGIDAADLDRCMALGAGVPMGPLALLDMVGLDVARAIGEAIGATIPARLQQLIDEGALGRKSRRGFYEYE